MRSISAGAVSLDEHTESVRFIPDTAHAVVDYLLAFFLIGAPFVLGFQAVSPIAHWPSVVTGVVVLAYSLLTDHALGLKRWIPLDVHLMADFAVGLAFVAVPFAMGFDGFVRGYYLVLGVFLVNLALSSRLEIAGRSSAAA